MKLLFSYLVCRLQLQQVPFTVNVLSLNTAKIKMNINKTSVI